MKQGFFDAPHPHSINNTAHASALVGSILQTEKVREETT
jgi:hypothetical protein